MPSNPVDFGICETYFEISIQSSLDQYYCWRGNCHADFWCCGSVLGCANGRYLATLYCRLQYLIPYPCSTFGVYC